MFLAAAPLETLADSGALVGLPGADAADAAYRFAADWRHGMAGNFPLYMPGFFALAIASWFWCVSGDGSRSIARLATEAGLVLVAALVAAGLTADAAGPAVAELFERETQSQILAPWPAAPWRAFAQGLYTAAAWTAGVTACRLALSRRSLTPLAVIPPATVVLALIRPWTVDDFLTLWITRVRAGEQVAAGSALAIPLVAWILVWIERPPQWVQTHWRRRRISRDA